MDNNKNKPATSCAFTPGPWKWKEGYFGGVVMAGNQEITHLEPYDYVDKANGQLIAAAPDMHAAILQLLRVTALIDNANLNADDEQAMNKAVKMATAALRKARGEGVQCE